MAARLRVWARSLKQEIGVLYFALRDPGTPWYAKALGLLVVGYALSPLDLIPDFIPVLGYLDDLLLLPLGLALFRRLVPAEVLERSRRRAREELGERRLSSRAAAAVVIALWLLLAGALVLALLRRFGGAESR